MGKEVAAFESEFSAYIGCAHGIGVGSGTEAIHMALKACGIGPCDEVITVSHTAVATVAAIEAAGAVPVLVDIEPDYFTMDPDKMESAIGPHTKAVIPVHLYGQPANLSAILGHRPLSGTLRHRRLRPGPWGELHEQACWHLGDMACFSFYPTKNLAPMATGAW